MWEWIYHSCAWVSVATALVAENPNWALTVAFLAAIIEALALVGTFIPGTFIVMAVAGAAAAAGQRMLPFLAVAVVGAVIGDFLSYWIGYRFRFTVRHWWPLAQRPHLMAGADRFFERYGSYSVGLGSGTCVSGAVGRPVARQVARRRLGYGRVSRGGRGGVRRRCMVAASAPDPVADRGQALRFSLPRRLAC